MNLNGVTTKKNERALKYPFQEPKPGAHHPEWKPKLDREGNPTGEHYARYKTAAERKEGHKIVELFVKKHADGENSAEYAEYLRRSSMLTHFPIGTELTLDVYPNGFLEVFYPVNAMGNGTRQGDTIKRASRCQSKASRRSLVKALQVSKRKLPVMALLSFPEELWATMNDASMISSRTNFVKRLRRKLPSVGNVIYQEYNLRGGPHFHACLTEELVQAADWKDVHREGAKEPVQVACGPFAEWFAQSWADCLPGASKSVRKKSVKFGLGWEEPAGYQGGMLELFRADQDGAAKYAAKEAAKQIQKEAPWDVSQWWSRSRCCMPGRPERKKIMAGDLIKHLGGDLRMMAHIYPDIAKGLEMKDT